MFLNEFGFVTVFCEVGATFKNKKNYWKKLLKRNMSNNKVVNFYYIRATAGSDETWMYSVYDTFLPHLAKI